MDEKQKKPTFGNKPATFANVDMSGNLPDVNSVEDFLKAPNIKKSAERRGRPRLPREEKRSQSIMVNVTEDRMEILRNLAKKNGVSLSSIFNYALSLYIDIEMNKKI